MNDYFRYLIALLIVIFICFLIYLILKRKLSEKDSLLWIFGSLILIVIALNPSIFDSFANTIGVDYPPALIFATSILILLFIIFINTLNISKLKKEIIELTQFIAIMEDRNSEVEKKLEGRNSNTNESEKKFSA